MAGKASGNGERQHNEGDECVQSRKDSAKQQDRRNKRTEELIYDTQTDYESVKWCYHAQSCCYIILLLVQGHQQAAQLVLSFMYANF